ncbi:MBL fold metallo-hydrolase [bacterium]|nr:MBL fold metallo-hydrolase [bacterium]
MRVRIWGARGSVPTPGAHKVYFGGNTSCVEIDGQTEDLLVCDAGTGLYYLGQDIMRRELSPKRIHILLSHLHWDHIQGLPFFAPAFSRDYQVIVYYPRYIFSSGADMLRLQQRYSGLDDAELDKYSLDYRELDERAAVKIGGWCLRTVALNHSVLDLGYRIEAEGKSVCYCTDAEPGGKLLLGSNIDIEALRSGQISFDAGVLHESDRELLRFIYEADLCIQDAMFDRELFERRVGWGHSPYEFTMELAYIAKVKRLLMFHFDPANDDNMLRAVEAKARDLAGRYRESLQIFNAREGWELLV